MALFSSEDASINNVLNKGSSVKGNLVINGFMRVDGDIDGDIECSGSLIIAEHARVRGSIIARSVAVTGGIVIGDVRAPEYVHLHPGSILLGDIETHSFKAENRTIFNGHCISIKDETTFEEECQKWQNTTAIVSKAFKA